MKVEITFNDEKRGIELLFSEELSKELADRLKEFGFKQGFKQPLKWYATQHPAYNNYAEDLKKGLLKGKAFTSVHIQPSFEPSEQNINHNKFSYVTISFNKDAKEEQENYVVFDSYKAVATAIATRFGKNKYQAAFLGVDVSPRNYKRKARTLLKQGKVIEGIESTKSGKDKFTNEQGVYTPEIAGERFVSIEIPIPATAKYSATIKTVLGEDNLYRSAFSAHKNFGDHSGVSSPIMENSPTYESWPAAIEGAAQELIKKMVSDFNNPDSIINNETKKQQLIRKALKAVWEYLTHEYGIDIDEPEIEKKTTKEENLEQPIIKEIPKDKIPDTQPTLPTGPPAWELTPFEYQKQKAIEKTGSSMVLDAKDKRDHEIIIKQALVEGKAIPQKVLDHYLHLVFSEPEAPKAESESTKYDYIDRVIAHMHDKYINGERPTKGQIEKIAKELGVPNMGMMWEATELSWLLWYKNIYNQNIPFEDRLAKMVHFWNKLQPTYAYSDTSKEIYKQYSTPCPISAIIAQYTGMDTANKIFEPSAGNGLLLVGAEPKKTHANEIDPTRLASLKFQGFGEITTLNATIPFPDKMVKRYDVVVTNPPFANWEDEKFDKDLIVRQYFNKHVGLEKHIRLEHLMAGLALHCMKNTGKAAIIIMGHVHFAHDGFIAKYRPFFNWLYRNYKVDDVVNMNSFKLYNKQGAIERTMLILIGGRKRKPEGVAPTQKEAPHLYDMVNSFPELWERVKGHIKHPLDIIIQQLQIALAA